MEWNSWEGTEEKENQMGGELNDWTRKAEMMSNTKIKLQIEAFCGNFYMAAHNQQNWIQDTIYM